MENQHRQIKGYKELDQKTIDAMNVIKNYANQIPQILQDLKSSGVEMDPRWQAIGTTKLQEGFMAINRAITKPDFF